MAYNLTPSGDPDENGVYRKIYCTVTHPDFPGQAVETEFENTTVADAETSAQDLDDLVAANPAGYFTSPEPEPSPEP